jgi:hypothetical protein
MSIRRALCATALLPLISLPAYAHGPSGHSGGAVAGTAAKEAGKLTLGIETEFTDYEHYSDAELAAYASHHVHAHGVDYSLTNTVNAAYGVTDNFAVGARLPHVYRNNVRAASHVHGGGGTVINSADEMGDSSGVGDLTVTGNYRLINTPAFHAAVQAGVKIPTGRTNVSLGGETLEAEHQPGSGSWDGIAGASMGMPVGPVDLDFEVSYIYATEGTQNTDLGDRVHYNIGASHDVSSRWTLVLELNGEWEGVQRVSGVKEENSSGSQILLSPGARFSPVEGVSLYGSLGVPIVSDLGLGHAETDYRVLVGASKSF